MGFFSTEKPAAQQHYILDKPLKCHHCGSDLFHKRKSLLPQAPATFTDWAHRSASCYECANCHYLHWFIEDDK